MIDDPLKPEFASWDSYNRFARSVRCSRRYVLGSEDKAFLSTVLATNRDRDVLLPEGRIFYRAQSGIDWHMRTDDDGNELVEEPVGFGAIRMKPRANQANQGRANPAGIPALYLGTTEKTAISEIRPWIGASISVAQFKTARDLKAIDLSLGHGKSSFSEVGFRHLFGGADLDPEAKKRAVWIDIDNAFSCPVTSTGDTAGYVPTQILSELFRDAGYDGIAYKSQFDDKGFNIALFNLDDAFAINCAPYEVTAVNVDFREIGNRWYSTEHLKSS